MSDQSDAEAEMEQDVRDNPSFYRALAADPSDDE
jgi:hypothetical protein